MSSPHRLLFPVLSGNRPATWLAALGVGLALVALPFVMGLHGNAWVRILDFALLYVMLALGLNIVVGYAGLLDLGYVAFYAIGAYLYALLASPHLADNFELLHQWFPDGLHTSMWLVIPLALGLAAGLGVLLGAPTLRLRGDYLAVVTMGFGEIVRIFLNNLNAPLNITNGPQGIGNIDPISIAGVSLSRSQVWFGIEVPSVHLYYYVFLTLTMVLIVVSVRLQDSRVGRAWMAIREDEMAAKAMGIHTRNIKLLAFAIGASFGGAAGALFAAFQGFVSPESFTLMESIMIVAMVVLGGMGHIPGVILGAVVLYAIPEVLRYVAKPMQEALFGHEWVPPESLRILLFGLAMVLIMLYRPHGLWPARGHPQTSADSSSPPPKHPL